MAFSYTNRKGKTYYLHRAVTKQGKCRYHFARQVGDRAEEELPEGYEVRESVNGQVSVARTRSRATTEAEEAEVWSALRRLRPEWRLDVQGRDLIVYKPWRTAGEIESSLREMGLAVGFAGARLRRSVEETASREQFEAVLKFTLVDERNRRFEARRMTYRGDGGWSYPLDCGSLLELVEDLVPVIGADEFFELM